MSEFNNRISAQRTALQIVNREKLYVEPLLGLTEKSIDRWSRNNRIDTQDGLIALLKAMSGTLFFLANKSQEQITEDYKSLSEKVSKQLSDLEQEMASRSWQLSRQ